MGQQRSDVAHEGWRTSAEKFDYFITGITGALAAFIGQNLQPERLGLNSATIELAALGLLIAAVVCGMRRIETHITLLRLQSRRLYELERSGAAVDAALKGGVFVNRETGDVLSAEQLRRISMMGKDEALRLDAPLAELMERSLALYRWRNRTLLLGFATLVFARIMPAYGF